MQEQPNATYKKALEAHVWTWLRNHITELRPLKTQTEVYEHYIATSDVHMTKNAFTRTMYTLGFKRGSVKVGDSVKKKYLYDAPTGNTLSEDLMNPDYMRNTYTVCPTCNGTGHIEV